MNTENMNCPVFYCIGNHDLEQGKYGEEIFESVYGPVYYSFDVAGVHYIVTPMPYGDARPEYTTRWPTMTPLYTKGKMATASI